MKNITAVFLKQVKETFRNKAILIHFVMFPVLVIIMENAIKLENMPEHFFVKLFAIMFVGMAPLICMSSIISEEKENNTLRVLMMSNVKPFEYLIGVGTYVWIMCIIGAVVFAVCGGYSGKDFCVFMLVMSVGILLSALTGAVIGIFSKNQMSATSVSVPVTMFNESIEKIARVTYSQQMSLLINGIGNTDISVENIAVIGVNFLIAVVLFWGVYKKKGLE